MYLIGGRNTSEEKGAPLLLRGTVFPGTPLAPGAHGLHGPALRRDIPRVLLGDHTVLALAHRALAGWAQREARPVVVVDCGGFFDAYRLGLEARRRAIAPARLLERVQICRAFTGYQVLRALLNLPRRFAPGHRVLLLNPLIPLLDEDLPAADRPWLFRRLLDAIAHFARSGYAVRVCQRTVAGDPLGEAAAFEHALARRFPLLVAADGRIVAAGNAGTQPTGAEHGQEHRAVFPGGGPGGGGLRRLPPRPAARGPGALRHAVQLCAPAHAGGGVAGGPGPLPAGAAGHAARTVAPAGRGRP